MRRNSSQKALQFTSLTAKYVNTSETATPITVVMIVVLRRTAAINLGVPLRERRLVSLQSCCQRRWFPRVGGQQRGIERACRSCDRGVRPARNRGLACARCVVAAVLAARRSDGVRAAYRSRRSLPLEHLTNPISLRLDDRCSLAAGHFPK